MPSPETALEMICVGVLNETRGYERRVAIVPQAVAGLRANGLALVVESGAGRAALAPDLAYTAAGATIVDSAAAVRTAAAIIVCVGSLPPEEARLLRRGSVVIGLLQASTNVELLDIFRERDITAFSLERMPRIARAQSMDVLSSQSSLSGYKAVLLAANSIGKLFPMLMTAAGTVAPTRVLVLGAGVAGLQAIATARRLGALVQAYDIRPAAREQVESLGAAFVSAQTSGATETQAGYATELSDQEQDRQRQALAPAVRTADVVITTALVPGRRAPRLLTESMVESMAEGSVIVDLAAEAGGNCEVTVPGQTTMRNGVMVIGAMNLPSAVAVHASQLYSRNVTTFLGQILRDGELAIDLDDVVVGECCVTHAGQVRHELARCAEAVHA